VRDTLRRGVILVVVDDLEMDDCERVAYNYLTQHCGFKNVEREPEGKDKFPDFLVIDNRIAVEVRRLSKGEGSPQPGKKPQGLLEGTIPIRKSIERMLHSLGPPTGQVSWNVNVDYGQPDSRRRQAEEKAIARRLAEFRDSAAQTPSKITFDNYTLTLYRAAKAYHDCFILVDCSPYDAGGWSTGTELTKWVLACRDQKTALWKKDFPVARAKYPEWWLLLIDLIHHGRKADITLPPQAPPHNWDKIILINPFDYTQAFDI